MARQLIENLAAAWNPEKYTDEYTANLLRVIQAKMKGKSPKLVEERTTPKQADVVDLMARLRASLEGTKATGSSKKPAASKPRKASRSKREVA